MSRTCRPSWQDKTQESTALFAFGCANRCPERGVVGGGVAVDDLRRGRRRVPYASCLVFERVGLGGYTQAGIGEMPIDTSQG